MSNRAVGAVIDYGRLKGPQLALMLVIANGISPDSGIYPARVSTLKRQCHCSERAIQRGIVECAVAGELIILEQRGHASWFVIPIYEGEPGYAPVECFDTSHICTGKHTPIDVSREDAAAEDVRNARAIARLKYGAPQQGRREAQGGDESGTPDENGTPRKKARKGVTKVAPPADENDTPTRRKRHPGVTKVAPNKGKNTDQSLTVLVTGADLALSMNGSVALAEADPDPSPPLALAPLPDDETTDHLDTADSDYYPAPQVWRHVCDQLIAEKTISRAGVATWLQSAMLLGLTGRSGQYIVLTRTTYQCEQLQTRFADRIVAALEAVTKYRPCDVVIGVEP